jgi:hypothetical protein
MVPLWYLGKGRELGQRRLADAAKFEKTLAAIDRAALAE